MIFRTRFAPSPTGPLHLGHAYSALLAHDQARANNGFFHLRMDDIDQSPERAEALFHAMYSRLDAALIDWKVVNLLKVLPYLIPFLKLGVWFRSTFTRKNHG